MSPFPSPQVRFLSSDAKDANKNFQLSHFESHNEGSMWRTDCDRRKRKNFTLEIPMGDDEDDSAIILLTPLQTIIRGDASPYHIFRAEDKEETDHTSVDHSIRMTTPSSFDSATHWTQSISPPVIRTVSFDSDETPSLFSESKIHIPLSRRRDENNEDEVSFLPRKRIKRKRQSGDDDSFAGSFHLRTETKLFGTHDLIPRSLLDERSKRDSRSIFLPYL
eukprot:CAMPEP_0198303008 /NCGR_PEP_ID=MMETSP1449-20131203/56667_1 /TAXON_ID=420275 /ORGANISM="Attheya septentrionalis, Strain CCMP2084" /LENGTH=219 /DNA_ID=CAMNT_0044005489 /DNA_START=134 /DNA_END=793 /DNA_ORIENTATION=+